MTAFLLLAGAVVAVVFRRFLLGQAVYLYKDIGGDSINIFYPQMTHLFDYWRTEGIPGWSFSQGLGQNIFPFSWNDPFFLVLLPFGRDRWAYGIALMEVIKILAAGALFRLYLRKMRLSEHASTLGALAYSFSGFLILGTGWTIFSTEAVYCALALYAFELYLLDGSWALLPAAVALFCLFQPFYLFLYAPFFLVYGTIRFVDERGWDPKAALRFHARLAALGLLGIALGGVYFFSDILQLLQSPRVGGAAAMFRSLAAKPAFALSGPAQAATAFLRLLSTDSLGTGSDYRGWRNYLEAPAFYCGLWTLILAVQFFAVEDDRRRRLYGGLLALVVLPAVFPFFRYALWAFSGDYYRTLSLFVAVALILLAARALDRLESGVAVSWRWVAAPLAASFLAVGALARLGAPVSFRVLTACGAFLIAESATILLMRSPARARSARRVLLALACLEAAALSSVTVGARPVIAADELRGRVGYNDHTLEAVAYLRSIDGSFYRIDKDYRSGTAIHGSLNDAKAQGYYGTSSYAQFNQLAVVEFLGALGLIDPSRETDTHWLLGLGGRPALESLLGVKYLLLKGAERPDPTFWEPLAAFDDVRAFRNKHARPLAFTYDRLIREDDWRRLDRDRREAAILQSAVVDDERDFAPVPRSGAEARQEALEIAARSENRIEGTIFTSGPRVLFFSIPYDRGWTARVDGKPSALRRVNVGFSGLFLPPGEHRVQLVFEPPLRRLGAFVSLAALALYGLLLRRRDHPRDSRARL